MAAAAVTAVIAITAITAVTREPARNAVAHIIVIPLADMQNSLVIPAASRAIYFLTMRNGVRPMERKKRRARTKTRMAIVRDRGVVGVRRVVVRS